MSQLLQCDALRLAELSSLDAGIATMQQMSVLLGTPPLPLPSVLVH